MTRLVGLDLRTVDDVFVLRRLAREVGAAVGLDHQDQVRLATALSEVGREVLRTGPAAVAVDLEAAPPRLVVTARCAGPLAEPAPGEAGALVAARRLVDEVVHEPKGEGTVLVLVKTLPHRVEPDLALFARLRAVVRDPVATPLDELRQQNAELARTLDELRARGEELVHLNAELEETNRGVMAMYAQLSQELEETNRGVVALYAELDERGRQLIAANEAKTRFLRNVSHELRTPVNSILGLVDLLDEADLGAEERAHVGFLASSSRSLLGLVNELLDLARVESGRQEAHPTPVDLAVLLGELAGELTPVLAPGVRLVVDPPAVGTVVTDRELLARVLRNLLGNAAKFTVEGQVSVTVSRGPEAGEVVVAVRDTGVGIAPEHQQRVFEEFFQVRGPLQTAGRGTGLGLPYARGVVEALGGRLELVSEPGVGSTFSVVLPDRRPEPEPPAEPVQRLGSVLVVDDDAAFRAVLVGLLDGVAGTVREASDGEEALRLLADDAPDAVLPDAVLLDLLMPGLDGPGTLARMAGDERLAGLPVVLLSSLDVDGAGLAGRPGVVYVPKAGLGRRTLLTALAQAVTGGSAAG